MDSTVLPLASSTPPAPVEGSDTESAIVKASSTEQWVPGTKNKRRQRLMVMGMVTLLVVAGTMVTFFLVANDTSGGNGKDGDKAKEDDLDVVVNDTKPKPIVPPPPNSVFARPETVEWKKRGQMLRDDVALELGIPENATNEHELTEGIWGTSGSLSGDGNTLVIDTTQRGYVVIYQYNTTVDEWQFDTKLTVQRSSGDEDGDKDNDYVLLFELSSFLAVNGKHLAVLDREGGSAYVYEKRNNGTWVQHDRETIKTEGGSLAWDYSGTYFAAGAPVDGRGGGKIVTYTSGNNDDWQTDGIVEGEVHTLDGMGAIVQLSHDGNTMVGANPWRHITERRNGQVWTWKRATTSTSTDKEWILVDDILGGLVENEEFGISVQLSGNGKVLAVQRVEGQERLSVYDFVEQEQDNTSGDGTWVIRPPVGIHDECRHERLCDFCLSADGNFLVFASLESVQAFQYQPSSSGSGDYITEWVQVGVFLGPTGTTVSCSNDGHIVLIGQSTLPRRGATDPGETGKFIVWEAVEGEI
eukprot:scaffold5135_cov166-Amphora_coffeaeformis.AAC.2